MADKIPKFKARLGKRLGNIGELWLTFGLLDALLRPSPDKVTWDWYLLVVIISAALLFPSLILGIGGE